MSDTLLSVGLDVGTTSTQMVLSELTVENRAGSFSVPEMVISRRRILYRSPVRFTPLLRGDLVDAAKLRQMLTEEYAKAGICRGSVDTGAVIITGETGRKENAAAVLEEISDLAGDFVVAAAGPDLESVLAARGAGADLWSRQRGKTVLHMDIGGGTSNLALIRDGEIQKTGCLNVGGRLLKLDEQGIVTYVSPVLEGIWDAASGERMTERRAEQLAEILVRALEMAAGCRERTRLLDLLWTKEAGEPWTVEGEMPVISFSGGVADCIEDELPWLCFGDIGPVLGRQIRASGLCRGTYILGQETIRATVIGAGCHSARLSGSTVFYRNVTFPLKNLPVVVESENAARELVRLDGPGVLALQGGRETGYEAVQKLAEKLRCSLPPGPVYLCMEQDMAKALGQLLALLLEPERPILCIDRVRLSAGDYLDVGAPVGPALPVVIKTLVLSQ